MELNGSILVLQTETLAGKVTIVLSKEWSRGSKVGQGKARPGQARYLSLVQVSSSVPPLEVSQLSLETITLSLAAPELLTRTLQAHLSLPLLLPGNILSNNT